MCKVHARTHARARARAHTRTHTQTSSINFEDEEDLTAKIDARYAKLDEDGSGGLCYEEFRAGLRETLGLAIALTR